MNNHYLNIDIVGEIQDFPTQLRRIAELLESGTTSIVEGCSEEFTVVSIVPAHEADPIHAAKDMIACDEYVKLHGTTEGFNSDYDIHQILEY